MRLNVVCDSGSLQFLVVVPDEATIEELVEEISMVGRRMEMSKRSKRSSIGSSRRSSFASKSFNGFPFDESFSSIGFLGFESRLEVKNRLGSVLPDHYKVKDCLAMDDVVYCEAVQEEDAMSLVSPHEHHLDELSTRLIRSPVEQRFPVPRSRVHASSSESDNESHMVRSENDIKKTRVDDSVRSFASIHYSRHSDESEAESESSDEEVPETAEEEGEDVLDAVVEGVVQDVVMEEAVPQAAEEEEEGVSNVAEEKNDTRETLEEEPKSAKGEMEQESDKEEEEETSQVETPTDVLEEANEPHKESTPDTVSETSQEQVTQSEPQEASPPSESSSSSSEEKKEAPRKRKQPPKQVTARPPRPSINPFPNTVTPLSQIAQQYNTSINASATTIDAPESSSSSSEEESASPSDTSNTSDEEQTNVSKKRKRRRSEFLSLARAGGIFFLFNYLYYIRVTHNEISI